MAIEVPGRSAPVLIDADVVVAGGGSAGIAAAVTAAQQGARTVLLERYGFLGGNATAAYVGSVCGLWRTTSDGFDYVSRGFAQQWAESLVKRGGAFGPAPYKESAVLVYVPWHYKRQADVFVQREPNLTALLHATVTDVVRTGRVIDAVIVGSKRGPVAITASVFIDASGDADVAFHAGCRVESGGAGQRQFPSIQLMMQHVDVQAFADAGLNQMLGELLATTGQSTQWNLTRSAGSAIPSLRPGEVTAAMTRVGVGEDYHSPDMTDLFEATEAEFTGRAVAERTAAFLKAEVPGFGESYLADTPTQLGIRETRRGVGEYVMTGEDVLGAARFDDAIGCGAWPQELHVTGKGTEYIWLEPGAYYQMPLRSLIAADADNLLLAGRCFSATHEALASTRVIGPSMTQGEAAGVIAALAAQKGLPVRSVDAAEAQRILAGRGAFLG
ncbi:MAG: FAD-dependent oxidoreductase [Actinomycetota bacterium]|nr:FAD-dependent oxidoreductase [Actinomycetota bacterium]